MTDSGTKEKQLSLRDVHVFRERDRDFLLAVPICAFWNVDASAAAIVRRLSQERKTKSWTKSGLQDRFADEYGREQVGEIVDELAGVGLFYEDDGSGDAVPDRFPQSALQIGSLVCHVSHDCNLKCAYCYGDGGSYGGKEELMTEEMALDYVELLFANSGQLDSVHMTFFGGEPLMNMPVIRSAVARGAELSKETGKKISYSLTTNGTLVTPEIAAYLDQQRISVSLSLDGPPDINDPIRVFKDGSGESTYEAVRRVMSMFQKGRPLGTRVTLTRKSLDVSGIVAHLLKIGFFEVGVTPVNCGDPELDFDKEDLDRFHEECSVIGDLYLEQALAGGYYGFSNLSNVLRQLHSGEDKAYPCGAGIQLYAGDPAGNLFMCHRLVGNEKYQVGDVGQGIDHDRQAEFLRTVNLENKEGCSGCWARYICSGGCYYISELHYGDPSRTHHLYCRFLRKWYEYGIGLYAEIMERCPEFITKVLEPRINC